VLAQLRTQSHPARQVIQCKLSPVQLLVTIWQLPDTGLKEGRKITIYPVLYAGQV
jgi:hypothetical protein